MEQCLPYTGENPSAPPEQPTLEPPKPEPTETSKQAILRYLVDSFYGRIHPYDAKCSDPKMVPGYPVQKLQPIQKRILQVMAFQALNGLPGGWEMVERDEIMKREMDRNLEDGNMESGRKIEDARIDIETA